MSRVNLLPPEIKKRRANLRLAKRIRFFGLCAVLLLGGLYALRTFEVMGLRSDLADAAAERASVQTQIDGLSEVAQAQASTETARRLILDLMRGEISWSQQMLNLATTVPVGFRIDSVNGSGSGDPTQIIVGSLTFSATADGFTTTQAWIQRMQSQEGWANGWVGSAQGLPETVVSGSIDLTQSSLTVRGGRPQ